MSLIRAGAGQGAGDAGPNQESGIGASLLPQEVLAVVDKLHGADAVTAVGPMLRSAPAPVTRAVVADVMRQAGTADARDVLRGALADESDERVISRIASGLAILGDVTDVSSLLAAGDRVTGSAKNRVMFAAALIAYRLGSDGPDPQFPGPQATQLPTGQVAPVTSSAATEEERRVVLDGLQHDVGALVSDPDAITRIDCGRGVFVVLRGLAASSPETLSTRRALVGVGLEMSEATGQASAAMLILSRPTATGLDLFVTRIHGEPLYRGTGTVTAAGIVGTLDAVDAIGVAAAQMSFELVGSSLSVTGSTETSIRNQNEPTPAAN
jgi:hypothetical protein